MMNDVSYRKARLHVDLRDNARKSVEAAGKVEQALSDATMDLLLVMHDLNNVIHSLVATIESEVDQIHHQVTEEKNYRSLLNIQVIIDRAQYIKGIAEAFELITQRAVCSPRRLSEVFGLIRQHEDFIYQKFLDIKFDIVCFAIDFDDEIPPRKESRKAEEEMVLYPAQPD